MRPTPRNSAIAATAGLLLVAVALFAGVGPASAAPASTGGSTAAAAVSAPIIEQPAAAVVQPLGLASCPSGYACFWVNSDYGGTMGKVAGDNPNYMNLANSSGCTSYPGTWNDCISSIANRGTQCTVYFYANAGYDRSWYHSLSRGDEVADFGSGYHDAAFNDQISSNKWCTP